MILFISFTLFDSQVNNYIMYPTFIIWKVLSKTQTDSKTKVWRIFPKKLIPLYICTWLNYSFFRELILNNSYSLETHCFIIVFKILQILCTVYFKFTKKSCYQILLVCFNITRSFSYLNTNFKENYRKCIKPYVWDKIKVMSWDVMGGFEMLWDKMQEVIWQIKKLQNLKTSQANSWKLKQKFCVFVLLRCRKISKLSTKIRNIFSKPVCITVKMYLLSMSQHQSHKKLMILKNWRVKEPSN